MPKIYKFRAWDEKNKVMVRENNVLIDFDGRLWARIPNTKPMRVEKLCDKPYVIMQFTGLKDKNGNEIYEGDVIDSRYGKQVVRWSLSHCGFIPFAYPNNVPNNQESKIIGNIYENPSYLNELQNFRK